MRVTSKLQSTIKRYAIVARYSKSDGLGHVHRSLALYAELHLLAQTHIFLLTDTEPPALLRDLSPAAWTTCSKESEVVDSITSRGINVIIFDTIHFSRAEFLKLKESTVCVSMSPIFDRIAEVDLVIHRSKYPAEEWKEETFRPNVIGGLDYFVGSRSVTKVSSQTYFENLGSGKVNVGVSLGGVDEQNLTLKVVDSLGHHSKRIAVWLALGEGYDHPIDSLFNSASDSGLEMLVFQSNDSMWKIFKNVSLLISAGGLTTYEAAAAGIPALCVLAKPEWEFLFQELVETRGISVTSAASFLENSRGALSHLLDPKALAEMRERLQDLRLENGARNAALTILENT